MRTVSASQGLTKKRELNQHFKVKQVGVLSELEYMR